MPDTTALLLFVKQPAAGRVKSRIAAALGERAAAALYRIFVLDLLDTVEQTGVPFRICVHPPEAIPEVSSWLGDHRTYLPQTGADLGERMAQAFRTLFAEDVERAVLIGSDLPDLPAGRLHEAMDALDRHDAVIGPARDGGYYLIGFRRGEFRPEVFRGIAWGRPDVFDRTMELFRKNGAAVHVLPHWQDADTIDDLRDLVKRGRHTPFAASRTMQYLTAIQDTICSKEDLDGHV